MNCALACIYYLFVLNPELTQFTTLTCNPSYNVAHVYRIEKALGTKPGVTRTTKQGSIVESYAYGGCLKCQPIPQQEMQWWIEGLQERARR